VLCKLYQSTVIYRAQKSKHIHFVSKIKTITNTHLCGVYVSLHTLSCCTAQNGKIQEAHHQFKGKRQTWSAFVLNIIF